jgi:hypothetical protein
MARYDKYDPISGGFRAPLAAAWGVAEGLATPFGVGLDANGRIVKGSGNTGVLGVIVVDEAHAAGDVMDVMTDGEIVDVAGLAAGTVYNAEADGDIVAGAGTRVGHTVEATRLVVRAAR